MNIEDELNKMYLTVGILLGVLALLAPHALSQTGADANYRNVTVSTQLNITNSFPEILSTSIADTHTLTAGSTTSIVCNTTVRDYDGINTVNVSAVFYDTAATTFTSGDDGNNHYTNSSCDLTGNTSYVGNFTCGWDVQYYANNATTWNCTINVTDDTNINSQASNDTAIEQLLALNITPQTLDYGNMEVGDISNLTPANITNFGNVNINVTVRGYGATENDNLAMVCTFNNIPVGEERFSLNSTAVYNSMDQLQSTDTIIQNLTILQRTNEATNDRINTTYWRIRVPTSSNPGGNCSGTLVFQAEVG